MGESGLSEDLGRLRLETGAVPEEEGEVERSLLPAETARPFPDPGGDRVQGGASLPQHPGVLRPENSPPPPPPLPRGSVRHVWIPRRRVRLEVAGRFHD